MADTVSKRFRSEIMKRVRSEGTTEERLLEEALVEKGLCPLHHVAELPGRPDFAFPTCKLAVFVDGDFWHGRRWFEEGEAPKSKTQFWIQKFEDNRRRDWRVDRRLRRLGWSVSRVWGSAVRKNPWAVADRVERRIATLTLGNPERGPRCTSDRRG